MWPDANKEMVSSKNIQHKNRITSTFHLPTPNKSIYIYFDKYQNESILNTGRTVKS